MKCESFLTMSDGVNVFVSVYEPNDREKIRGYIHILHGMAEHSGRYEHFCKLLAKIGYFVVIHDHRGHGKTAQVNGKLGFFANKNGFERVVTDVHEITEYIQKTYQMYRPIMFGHSMGSFILRRYIQKYSEQVEAAIICGTGATTLLHITGHNVAKMLVKLKGADTESPLLNDLSFGSFNKYVPNPITAFDWLTRDHSVVQRFIDDPHCGFIATNQFFVDLTQGLITINQMKEMACIREDLPVLFISGSEDPVGGKGAVGVFDVAEKMRKVGMTQIAVYIFEGMRHEILNERNKEHVYEVITRWLKNEQKI